MTNQADPLDIGLTFNQIEPLLEQDFTITIGEDIFALKLVEAKLLKHYVPSIHRRPPFSLLFHCADLRILPQGSYTLTHHSMDPQTMFFGPVAADSQGVSYEAVFN